MPMAFDTEVLWHQVQALTTNIWIWFVRAVIRVKPPALLAPDCTAQHSEDSCCFVEILNAGGVDQLRARSGKCWATCGYNIMKEFGGQLVPQIKGALPPGCVVVRNKAFSINYADVCIRWGLYESALKYVGWPIVPGFDIAGVVEAASEGSGYAQGDHVFGCSLFGGYSSRLVVPSRQLMRVPAGLTFEAAASLPAVAATALHAAHLAGLWPTEGFVGSNRDVLVHSAAGGVGDLLCQVLRLCGARVVGVVGQASKVSSCKANDTIDKSSEAWAPAARRLAPEGYRAIFDANGVGTLADSYALLGRNGRLVVYGFHSNLPRVDSGLGLLSPFSWLRMSVGLLRTPSFDPMDLTLQSKAVLGFNLSFFAEEIEMMERYFAQLGDWIASGKIAAPPVRTFALQDVREAHTALTSGRTVGKLVVTF